MKASFVVFIKAFGTMDTFLSGNLYNILNPREEPRGSVSSPVLLPVHLQFLQVNGLQHLDLQLNTADTNNS